MNSVGSNNLSLKYQRFTPSGGTYIRIRIFEAVTKTQFLNKIEKDFSAFFTYQTKTYISQQSKPLPNCLCAFTVYKSIHLSFHVNTLLVWFVGCLYAIRLNSWTIRANFFYDTQWPQAWEALWIVNDKFLLKKTWTFLFLIIRKFNEKNPEMQI